MVVESTSKSNRKAKTLPFLGERKDRSHRDTRIGGVVGQERNDHGRNNSPLESSFHQKVVSRSLAISIYLQTRLDLSTYFLSLFTDFIFLQRHPPLVPPPPYPLSPPCFGFTGLCAIGSPTTEGRTYPPCFISNEKKANTCVRVHLCK